MTDEQFNLYLNIRKEHRRACSDYDAFTDERARLDEVYRVGSQRPTRSDYGWLERILIALRIRKARNTLIPSERLSAYEERLKYLDEVVRRCDEARAVLRSKLMEFRPSESERRFVDLCDRCDAIETRIENMRRTINAMLK